MRLSPDAACILLVEGCLYVAWYLYDLGKRFMDDDNNPFGWW